MNFDHAKYKGNLRKGLDNMRSQILLRRSLTQMLTRGRTDSQTNGHRARAIYPSSYFVCQGYMYDKISEIKHDISRKLLNEAICNKLNKQGKYLYFRLIFISRYTLQSEQSTYSYFYDIFVCANLVLTIFRNWAENMPSRHRRLNQL